MRDTVTHRRLHRLCVFPCRLSMPRPCQTILGILTLVSSAGTLVGLWLEGQKGPADILQEELEENPDAPVLAVTKKWLNAHFAGERPAMADIPLAPAGSPFRQTVWTLRKATPGPGMRQMAMP